MTPKTPFILIGDFFFKWRNYAFPVILLSLFFGFRPAIGLSGAAADRMRVYLALGVIAAGLIVRFATIGWAYIKRGGAQKKVYADTLVVSGYFALCRNPLYVGNLMIYIGTCLLHGNWIVIAAGTAIFILIYSAIVAAEEHFLRAKFGADYDAYAARVARWWPALGRHRQATEGMQFSLPRAITKDYSTISSTTLSVGILLLLEVYYYRNADVATYLRWAGLVAVVVVLFGMIVRRYKRQVGPI